MLNPWEPGAPDPDEPEPLPRWAEALGAAWPVLIVVGLVLAAVWLIVK